MPYQPEISLGFTTVATSTSAKMLMDGKTIPAGTNKVRFTVYSQPAYFRNDGVTVTATNGIAYTVNTAAGNSPFEKYWTPDYLNTIMVVAGGTGSIVIEFIKEIV